MRSKQASTYLLKKRRDAGSQLLNKEGTSWLFPLAKKECHLSS